MNRRSFLTTSLTGSAIAATGWFAQPQPNALAQGAGSPQYLDLRRFVIKSRENRDLVTRFVTNAAIPGLNRLGVQPVGAFYEMPESGDHSVTLLSAWPSLEAYASAGARLGEDPAFMEAAQDYFSTEKSNPAYERIEAMLMRAFAAFPQVKVPRSNPDRIFELRTYQSHNEMKAYLKVEMFNVAELDIFARVGLDGVFYGQALVASNLPQLTYMLGFKDQAEREATWNAFRAHPDWKRLSAEPRYADTVSKIDMRLLRAAPGSQI